MCKGSIVCKIIDENGGKLVILPQIIFYGKRSIAWSDVEQYLLRYVGHYIEIAESKDLIYIGKDFVDEFTGSVYTRKLKGGLAKAKANLVQGICELIEIASEKRWNEAGEIVNYNIFRAVLIVRYAADRKLYLYDIQNIKKETSNPL